GASFGAEVAVGLIEPARGAVAIDDLPSRGLHAVGPATAAAQDDVVVEFQAREGGREDGQRPTVVRPQRPQPVHSEWLHVCRRERREGQTRLVQRRVQRCSGERLEHGQDHAFGAAALGEVIVDQGESHWILRAGKRWWALRSVIANPTAVEGTFPWFTLAGEDFTFRYA